MSEQLTSADRRVLSESADQHPRVIAATPQQSQQPAPPTVRGEPLPAPFKRREDGVPIIGGQPYLP